MAKSWRCADTARFEQTRAHSKSVMSSIMARLRCHIKRRKTTSQERYKTRSVTKNIYETGKRTGSKERYAIRRYGVQRDRELV